MCDVDQSVNTLEDSWRKARKSHRCFACHEEISNGQRYHFLAGIWDDVFGAFKHCARCWRMGLAIAAKTSEGWDLGLNCGETWESVFDEPPPAEIAELAFMTPAEAQKLAPR